MPENAGAPPADAELAHLLDQLVNPADGLQLDDRFGLAQHIRSRSPEHAVQLDHFLIDQAVRLRRGLERAREEQLKLRATFTQLTAPPWHPAVFLGPIDTGTSRVALVAHGPQRRAVTAAPEVDLTELAVGDDVFLGPELNLLAAKARVTQPNGGETALFDRWTADGRAVLRCRDEEVVVTPSGSLVASGIKRGAPVRWDRCHWLAFEPVEQNRGAALTLEETPADTFAMVGGLDEQLAELRRALRPDPNTRGLRAKYGLRRKGSVLLVGPPGNGKTMIARAIANWLAGVSPEGRSRFLYVAPGRLHSMWYGQSEANYRDTFRVAREAAAQDPDVPVVLFFDEVDAIGAARGALVNRIDDKTLTAFMTELDGLEPRDNVLVIAATNRRDALDPALARPGRLGDLVIQVPRPGRSAAHAILAKHLGPDLPYRSGDDDGTASRGTLLAAVIARMYSPNGLGELASITLRDGARRPVMARDLVSGAVLAQIAARACEWACDREAGSGEAGISLDDLFEATDRELETAAAALTPGNCRHYLADLPQDVDAVRVVPTVRKTRRIHRFLRLAEAVS